MSDIIFEGVSAKDLSGIYSEIAEEFDMERKIQIHYIKCIYIEAKTKEFGKIRAPPWSYSKRLSCSVTVLQRHP